MGYLLAKNLNGVSYKLQILHTTKLPRAQKKPQNNFLYGTPFIVKLGSKSENWNFHNFFPIFTKGIEAKLNELESESDISSQNEG